ncbi:unnamed protein product [Dicrocoelium dendriticum]|nr:unnamed protein product [Dicrocoelium dendriticum]
MSLKNFTFLLPHLPQFEGELKDLLIEIDKLIESKKNQWESELKSLECKLSKKAKENQILQEKIRAKEAELHATSTKLQTIESKLSTSNQPKELTSPKSTVDWMNSSLKKLHAKYHKLFLAESEKHSVTLRKIEEHNAALLDELRKSKEDCYQKVEDLMIQLQKEKLCSEQLQTQCSQLQNQLKLKHTDLEKERSKNLVLQSAFHERQVEFDSLLKNANRTSELQTSELSRLRLLLEAKQTELRRLSSEASSKKSELLTSKRAVARLEAAVAKHISAISNSQSPRNLSSFGDSCLNIDEVSRSMTYSELDSKLRTLEQHLNDSHLVVQQKMEEISQLERACHTAAATIHRLIESKTLNEQRISSLKVTINGTLAATRRLSTRVKRLENTVLHKISTLRTRLEKLKIPLTKLGEYSATFSHRPSVCSIGIQHYSNVAHTAMQTCAGPTISSSRFTSKADSLADDWSNSAEKLQRTVDTLAEEKTRLETRLIQQAECMERLQKENLLLSNLLAGSARGDQAWTPCSPNSPNRHRSNPAAANETDEGQQLSDLPSSSSVSIAIESPDEAALKPSLSLTTPFVNCRSSLPTDAVPTMDFVSSGYHSSGELIHDSHTVTFIEANDSVDEPSKSTEFIIPFSASNLDATLQLKDDQTALTSAPESDCVRFQLSPLSLSPSEYDELPVPKSASIPALLQSPSHPSFHECPRFFKDVVSASDITSKWSPTTRVAPSDAAEIILNVTPTPSISPSKQRITFLHDDETEKNKRADRLQVSNSPPQAGLILSNPGDDLSHFAPHIHSTAHKRSSDVANSTNNEEDEDTSVYCLAAKFLANEQEYCLRLEEQIDSHLAALEKQIGLRSPIVT